jgi:hypothetical protein
VETELHENIPERIASELMDVEVEQIQPAWHRSTQIAQRAYIAQLKSATILKHP